jgi:hypothetical protein
MVVVDGDDEDWAGEELMFILVPAKELLRSDRDNPKQEIFLQKLLILQKLSRQQNLWRGLAKKSVVSYPWSQSSGVSRPGIDDYFNYVVDSNSTKELSPPNF